MSGALWWYKVKKKKNSYNCREGKWKENIIIQVYQRSLMTVNNILHASKSEFLRKMWCNLK